MTRLVVCRDPFHRVRREWIEIEPGRSIRECVPEMNGPFIVLQNGQAVLRADWSRPVAADDVLMAMALPQGGDDGGSDPMKIVAAVVLFYIGDWADASLALAGMEGAGAIVSTGFTMAASMMLSSAFLSAPRQVSSLGASELASPSPTYSLSAQGNLARIGGAIPVQYGRMCAYPDFAAQPYIEYAGNEQYLYQLFCLGAGEFSIEAIRIDDTAIDNFDEITYEVVAPGADVTLFPVDVATSVEVSGQELVTSTWIGPFTANAAGTTANALGIDLVLPRGLYHYNSGTGAVEAMAVYFTVQAREIDDTGAPVGSWTTLGTESIADTTTTPQRVSKRYTVTSGRYEMQIQRTDTKQTDSSYGHELLWGGMRAYLDGDNAYGDVTLIAMRMRASNNLSMQASRRVNVISTRKLPVWNGSSWSGNTATAGIAWALADALKNTGYGGKLTDSRIDLAGLLALDATWTTRGDEFNGRFDSALTLWEALSKIAQAGRAKPYLQGGIVRFARDQAASVPVALFSMRNIVKGSFSVSYIMPSDETADAVDVTYWDSARWASQTVQAKLPGSSAATPARVDMSVGITSRDHAYREGLYYAACNRYRRKRIGFTTEMEGFIPSFGDLVAVAHDMPAWGQTAEVAGWNAGTLELTVSEPLTWGTGVHYIGLRTKAGAVDGPIQVSAGSGADKLILAAAPSFTPYSGTDYERTHVVFGWAETWRQPARVLSVKPRGLTQVEIECVNEDDNVHAADEDAITPSPTYSQLPTIYTAPVIAGLVMRASPSDPDKAMLSWTPAPGADRYLIEMANAATGAAWTRVGDTTANNFAVTAIYGSQTWIRVAAVGMTVGPWVTMLYGSAADYMWNSDGTTLMWNADDTTLMWSY